MDREMLLAVVRRGNLRVRPWGERVLKSIKLSVRSLGIIAVRAGEGVDRGG
jgi:hypothetical protein